MCSVGATVCRKQQRERKRKRLENRNMALVKRASGKGKEEKKMEETGGNLASEEEEFPENFSCKKLWVSGVRQDGKREYLMPNHTLTVLGHAS